jgi:hypothetical protein
MLQTAKRSHGWRGGSAGWGIVISQNEWIRSGSEGSKYSYSEKNGDSVGCWQGSDLYWW